MKLRGDTDSRALADTQISGVLYTSQYSSFFSTLIQVPVFAIRLMMKKGRQEVWWYLLKDTGGN